MLFNGNCQRGTYIFYREYIPSPPSEVYVPFDITNKKKHSMSRSGFKIKNIFFCNAILFLGLCETAKIPVLSTPTCSPSIHMGMHYKVNNQVNYVRYSCE